ncbi:UNVERIFIED_CONTAM: hypothetical protein Sangu_2050500 [Sesamum angustifolium]|uniref:Endoplasmic reticulum transmembrane protein n=1 Tax=Sesamum angustifolium TaxID=2727405 RepID=A0AAW2LJK8_9LAMI
MALQWVILAYVVAAEAAVAIILTLPSPKALKSRIVSLISLILQPSLFVIPFSGFQLLDIYWKNEHRLMCSGEICTAAERIAMRNRSTSLRGMQCYVRLHACSIGAFTGFASIIGRSKAWRNWRRVLCLSLQISDEEEDEVVESKRDVLFLLKDMVIPITTVEECSVLSAAYPLSPLVEVGWQD